MPSVIIDLSSSMSVFIDKRDPVGSHFRWDSIKKFLFLACTYSNSIYNFDVFSKLCTEVSLYDFIFLQFGMGTTYLFMDFFMKLYTRRVDAQKLINPLLRGVAWGLFLQTGMWALFHSQYVGDTLRFLFSSFRTYPGWSKCTAKAINDNITCIPSDEILYKCQVGSKQTTMRFIDTSSHHNYIESFIDLNRTTLTTRFFILAIVWVTNFFFATVSDDTLLKIFKLSFIFRTSSTLVILTFLYYSAKHSSSVKAFNDIFNLESHHSHIAASSHVAYMYGIGFLGLHDFTSMSVYTMVDNAVIIYTVFFTTTALLRSWVIRVLYLELTRCVKVDDEMEPHYLIFAILPLSTEFFYAHKLYIFYLYLNVVISTTAYLIMLTLTMARILHSEFNSVKNIYLVGMLCCMGFGLSLIFASSPPNRSEARGVSTGVNVIIFYLGAFKAALIMWVYGVQRFSTDIHYWLGFKPTRYWTICWMFLPIMLIGCLTMNIHELIETEDITELITAITWIALTCVIVAFFQIKTIAKFLLQNNLVNVISPSKRYGPPDSEDRKRRKNFDETLRLRQCTHNCHQFDELIDCQHAPILRTESGTTIYDTDDSLTNIFEAKPTVTRLRVSDTMHIS